jgi:hypothetical protein
MPVSLTTKANDGSTYVVTAAFTDEDGVAVSPDSLVWTLKNRDGDIINSREDVTVDTPSSSENIVLSGDDILYSDGAERILILEATYTSSSGEGLPLKDSVQFEIQDLIGV